MLTVKNVVMPSSEQWEVIIRGMRNPKNSWDRSDSIPCRSMDCDDCKFSGSPCSNVDTIIGPNDHKLMSALAKGGPVHAKYRRMITVYLDITAPLYWWKEFDTYKIGTVANSCSTMHKIHSKKFEMTDFSTEYLMPASYKALGFVVKTMNEYRDWYNSYDDLKSGTIPMDDDVKELLNKCSKKDIWMQMIQLLPTSYNQTRTVMLNYEVLVSIYQHRKTHKLDEWHTFCDWIENLPYSELIIGEKDGKEE